MKTFWLDMNLCIWQSDFDGVDCGYDDIEIVSYYCFEDYVLEVNNLTGEILNIFCEHEKE